MESQEILFIQYLFELYEFVLGNPVLLMAEVHLKFYFFVIKERKIKAEKQKSDRHAMHACIGS